MTFITRRHLLLGGGAVALGMLKQTKALAALTDQVPPRPALLRKRGRETAERQFLGGFPNDSI